MEPIDRHVQELFRKLKLHDACQAYMEQMGDPSYSSVPFDQRITHILERQLKGRSDRKVARLYKKSRIDDLMPGIDKVDYSVARGLSKPQFTELCKCNWVLQNEPRWLSFCGATGTGKTFLAKTILMEALKKEIPGIFMTVRELGEKLEEAHKDGTLRELRKMLSKHQLLVLDDFVLKGFSQKIIGDLLDLLEARYKKQVIVFTSQYPIEEWYDQMGSDGIHNDALVDRIVNNTHVINLTGGSMRERYKGADLFG